MVVSGNLVAKTGISGSLTQLTDGSSYLIAGDNVTISTGSSGAITITSNASGGSGGDPGAEYLVLSATGSLSAERVFTIGTGLSASDGGSGAAYTIYSNPQRYTYHLTSSHDSSYALDIPAVDFSSNLYSDNRNEIFLNGQLMTSGSGYDYTLGPTTGSIIFNMNLLAEDVVTIRQS